MLLCTALYQRATYAHVHVATLPYEEAQRRAYEAHHAAREAGYPLSFYLEPDV
ncbi:MAG: hypothetical protein ACUVSY_08435 [Roseiflexus sp.]